MPGGAEYPARRHLCGRHPRPGGPQPGDRPTADHWRLIAIDRDQAALEAAPERLESHLDKVTLIHGNFGDVAAILRGLNIPAVDGMLFDLGVSSPQLDDGSRGFSYQHDAPLDMRMDQSAPLTAFDVVNGWSQEELRRILWQYGEERYSGPIAAAIVRAREQAPIQTTGQLADLIRGAMPAKAGGKSSTRQSDPSRPSVSLLMMNWARWNGCWTPP